MELSHYFDNVIIEAFVKSIPTNDEFWRQRFLLDFGWLPNRATNWRHLYLSYSKQVWMVGNNQAKFLRQIFICYKNSDQPLAPLRAKEISIARNQYLIISPNHSVWISSNNLPPQPVILNNEIFYAEKIAVGNHYSLLIDLDGQIWQLRKNFWKPIQLPDNSQGQAVAVGRDSSYILDASHRVWVLGSNLYGQLGLGDVLKIVHPQVLPLRQIKQIACGRNHTLLLDKYGHVWSAGDNSYGQLGTGRVSNQKTFTLVAIDGHQIAAGRYHSLFVDHQRHLLMFGRNNYGQLGLGDFKNRFFPTPVIQSKGKLFHRKKRKLEVISADAGDDFTAFLDLSRNVWVFGRNHRNQLGLGDKINRNIPTLVPTYLAGQLVCGGNTLCLYN